MNSLESGRRYFRIGGGVMALAVAFLILHPWRQESSEPSGATSTAIASKPTTIDPICEDRQNDFSCYDTYYSSLVKERGITEAFDDLKLRYDQDAFVKSQCHPIVHVIGRAASQKFQTPEEAFSKGDGFCWSGYYHGVMEGLVARLGLDFVLKDTGSLCQNISDRASLGYNYFYCVHGLGHGLMAVLDDDLPDALRLCATLKGDWERKSCDGGVFMENIVANGVNHKTKFLKPAEPLYPCTMVADQHREACYLIQSSYFFKLKGEDYPFAFAQCAKAEPRYRDICTQSIGRDAFGFSQSDVDETIRKCKLAPTEEQTTQCAIGAGKFYITYTQTDDVVPRLCAELSAGEKEKCLGAFANFHADTPFMSGILNSLKAVANEL